MAKPKNKNFRDWIEHEVEEYGDSGLQYTKKDGKRYDRKKAKIQNERRNKNRNKFSHLE